MTSEEIKQVEIDFESNNLGSIEYWLKVIALQLAIANERNAENDKMERKLRILGRPPKE